MKNYAKIENGTVVNIIVAGPKFIERQEGTFVESPKGLHGGVYYDRQTRRPAEDQSIVQNDEAYARKNSANIGYTYDSERDAFIPPKPFNSWVLNEDSCLWGAPIAYPDDGEAYVWDEPTTSWIPE